MIALEDVLVYIAETNDIHALSKIRLEAGKAIKIHKIPRRIEPHYSSWSLRVARELWNAVVERYPFAPDPNMQKWAEDIEKLHRIDKYEQGVIEAVMRWSQCDPFWRQQVRSGANLRRHFLTMGVRIKEEQNHHGAVTI